jgi:lipid A 4'-phosphatase
LSDRLRWTTGLLGLVVLLVLLPRLDLRLAALCYRPGAGFFLADAWPARTLYVLVPWMVRVLAAALLLALAASFLRPAARCWRAPAAFALLSLALGPGLVANTLFKDHWGRPRPEQIVQFGGSMQFVPAPLPSRQCDRNCSFVSGHAAAGFWLIAGAWVWPRQRRAWLAGGIAFGTLVGVARMLQGGHFASDVLGALVVVWGCNALLYRWMSARGWGPMLSSGDIPAIPIRNPGS